MPRPRISVCVPARNAARWLRATLDSVSAQTFEDYELLVCDNASEDATAEIAGGLADSRLRVFRFDQPVGQAGNWNRCLERARGQHVVLLHADDLLRPGYLAAALGLLEREPGVGLVHCAVDLIRPDGAVAVAPRLAEADRVLGPAEGFRKLLVEGCFVNPAGVMVPRIAYDRVGRFSEAIAWGIDWHMWLRIAARWSLGYLASPLALYRLHEGSGTTGVLASGCTAEDERWVVEDAWKHAPQAWQAESLRKAALCGVAHRAWCHAEEAARNGQLRAARTGLKGAARVAPRILREPRFWALAVASVLGYRSFEGLRAAWRRIGPKRAGA